MNDPFLIPLTLGQTYTVLDIYGMVAFEAVFRGVLTDDNCVVDTDLLLFEKDPSRGGHRWAGAIAETDVSPKGVSVILRAHYYGATRGSLKRWNQSERPEAPKWVKA